MISEPKPYALEPAAPVRPPALLLAGLLACYVALIQLTWGRWGDIRVDCGGMLDRAARIAEGALLYRDVQSPYGPLADYILAAAFRVFGIHLNVAYALGLATLTVESWLLWYVCRRFLGTLECAAGLLVFWLRLGFPPGLVDWPLPNTYSATCGALFATATVALLVADLERPTRAALAGASLCAAAAGLAKIEHGVAAAGVLVAHAALMPRAGRSRLEIVLPAFVPGALLAVAVAAVFVGLVPWRTLVFDNVYRIRSFERTAPALKSLVVGAQPLWPSIREAGLRYGLEFAGRAVVLATGLGLIARGGLRRAGGLVLVLAALAVPAVPGYTPPRDFQILFATIEVRAFSWTGGVWPLVLLVALIAARRTGSMAMRSLALVAVLSIGLTLRWSFRAAMAPYYGVFAPFLVVLLVRTLARPLAGARASLATTLVLLPTVASVALASWTTYQAKTAVLDYPRGRIHASPSLGSQFASLIDYLRANTSADDFVSVIPEERLVNFLAERRNPTHDSGIGPAWLATPADEEAFLADLDAHSTPVIVISRRTYPEFGTGSLGAYQPNLMQAIEARYTPVWSNDGFIVCRRSAHED